MRGNAYKRRTVRDSVCNNNEDDCVLVSAGKGGKAKVKVKITISTALDAPNPHPAASITCNINIYSIRQRIICSILPTSPCSSPLRRLITELTSTSTSRRV